MQVFSAAGRYVTSEAYVSLGVGPEATTRTEEGEAVVVWPLVWAVAAQQHPHTYKEMPSPSLHVMRKNNGALLCNHHGRGDGQATLV